jgi:alkylation response protein AidB-like acyl-CoA dehydrogenase
VDLELSDDQQVLRDNVRSVLAGVCPSSVVRGVFDGAAPPPSIWDTMVALDWPGLAIGEQLGGLGSTFAEVAIVAEELGRATVPSPFLATVTQFASMIDVLGDEIARERFLPRVARGDITGTLAYGEDGRWAVDAINTTATRDDEGWTLRGAKHAVLDGATADEIIVVARHERGLGAFVVPHCDVGAAPRAVLDPTLPVADLQFDDVVVPADRVLAAPGPDVATTLERAVQPAVVALASATTGTCRAIFEATLAYAKVREQYGRPIGSFQALQHRLTDMYSVVERATALCYFAALAIVEDGDDRAIACSAAKAAAGDCQRLVVEEGLQLHGGIGYMWESDLQFALKRAKAGDALFGDAVAHRAQIAARLGLSA